MSDLTDIASALETVRRRIAAAAHRAHRPTEDITLVAVSKTVPVERVRAAAELGQRAFGENRVQEGLDKISALSRIPIVWHLIGHLQSNKARKAVEAFPWIHSIDSAGLLQKVDAAAHDLGIRPSILIQVDLAREATKHGVDRAELFRLAQAALEARAVDLAGLMTIPPIPQTPEDSRPWFRQLRQLRDELVSTGISAEALRHLSMGMSDDFEVAIEEGATIVRVGSSIFGRRPNATPA